MIFAFLTLSLSANQVATGLALAIFGTGFSSLFGQAFTGRPIEIFRSIFPQELATHPVLRLVFGQSAYQDQDQAERPQNAGGVELVEWDEWFAVFDEGKLALVVNEDVPGVRENFYELIRQADR